MVVRLASRPIRNRAKAAGYSCLFATQALTSKFVPGMLAGGKAVGVFLHALRLEDGSGYKVILEAAPEGMYSEDAETGVAAMSAMIEKYVRAYPPVHVDDEALQKRPAGESAGTDQARTRTDKDEPMRNQRQHPRTNMKCRIRITHPAFGEVFATPATCPMVASACGIRSWWCCSLATR